MKKIIGLLAYLCPLVSYAQLEGTNDVSIGALLRTQAEKQGVRFAANYFKPLNSIDKFVAGQKTTFSFSPNVNIKTGSNDAFDGFVVKGVGLLRLTPKTVTLPGDVEVLDIYSFHHAFPAAVGIEANRSFSLVNYIGEVGYVPVYWNIPNRKTYSGGSFLKLILRQTKVAGFVQLGYKAREGAENLQQLQGGSLDQSEERKGETIGRLKGIAKFSPTVKFGQDAKFSAGVEGEGTLWYDFINGAFYHNIKAKAKLGYSDYDVSFLYEKGSGAPNFNQGDQISANLSISF
jgi:hypothetical protein